MRHAFTVDVEEYFQVSAFENVVRRREWGNFESRVAAGTESVLRLLDRYHVRATFFVLGWIADHHPGVVRDIVSAGHEVASHGYWHRLVYQQTAAEFRADLRRSIDVVSDTAACRVTAYRAPSFSITRDSLWALDILAAEGIELDASLYPIRHDRYGLRTACRVIHRIVTDHGPLTELPGTTCRRFGATLPVGGGGYLRLLPYRWTESCLDQLETAGRRFGCYIHTWELDAQQPRVSGASRLSRWRHYRNLAATQPRLERMLERYSFAAVSDCIADEEKRLSPLGGLPTVRASQL